jgi:hypothetical protein
LPRHPQGIKFETGERLPWLAPEGRTVPLNAVAERQVAIIAAGEDEWGAPSIALWWADAVGRPQAGWVVTAAEAFANPQVARRLLEVTRNRAVIGRCGSAAATLRRLAACAGIAAPDLMELDVPAPSGDELPPRCEIVRNVMSLCDTLARASLSFG